MPELRLDGELSERSRSDREFVRDKDKVLNVNNTITINIRVWVRIACDTFAVSGSDDHKINEIDDTITIDIRVVFDNNSLYIASGK